MKESKAHNQDVDSLQSLANQLPYIATAAVDHINASQIYPASAMPPWRTAVANSVRSTPPVANSIASSKPCIHLQESQTHTGLRKC